CEGVGGMATRANPNALPTPTPARRPEMATRAARSARRDHVDAPTGVESSLVEPGVVSSASLISFLGWGTGGRHQTKREHGLHRVQGLHSGVLVVVQRFRSDSGLFVHLHALATDGCFEVVGHDDVRFLPVEQLSPAHCAPASSPTTMLTTT